MCFGLPTIMTCLILRQNWIRKLNTGTVNMTRKSDMAYIKSYFDGVQFRQIEGMEHGELVMIHLSQFDKEIKKALEA